VKVQPCPASDLQSPRYSACQAGRPAPRERSPAQAASVSSTSSSSPSQRIPLRIPLRGVMRRRPISCQAPNPQIPAPNANNRLSHELPSARYTGYSAKNKIAPDTLRGYLIENKYFARNAFVMNILQTLTPCNPLKASILRPKYPPGGEGGTPSRKREGAGEAQSTAGRVLNQEEKRHAGTTPEGQ
jgi:hypothetical protein